MFPGYLKALKHLYEMGEITAPLSFILRTDQNSKFLNLLTINVPII